MPGAWNCLPARLPTIICAVNKFLFSIIMRIHAYVKLISSPFDNNYVAINTAATVYIYQQHRTCIIFCYDGNAWALLNSAIDRFYLGPCVIAMSDEPNGNTAAPHRWYVSLFECLCWPKYMYFHLKWTWSVHISHHRKALICMPVMMDCVHTKQTSNMYKINIWEMAELVLLRLSGVVILENF